MHWLNINLATLRSPAYLGSTPVERATWLQLLAYCADQENGGCIAGAAAWKDRQWQQTCGVTTREVRGASRLIVIEGGDVRVAFYPLDKQAEVQAKREAARIGGLNSGKSRARQNGSGGDAVPQADKESQRACSEAQLQANGQAPLERKEKEKEGNEKGMHAPLPGHVQRTACAADAAEGAGCAPVCLQSQAIEHGARLSPPCPEQWSRKWWEDSERRGWLGPDGLRIVKWQPALSSYWRGVQEMERRVAVAAGGAIAGNSNGNGNGANNHAPRERTMSAYEIKTRLEAIDDELGRIRMRGKDGRSEDGLRTVKIYTPEQEARRQELLKSKDTLRRKLTEV